MEIAALFSATKENSSLEYLSALSLRSARRPDFMA